jgi:hypothetical protein
MPTPADLAKMAALERRIGALERQIAGLPANWEQYESRQPTIAVATVSGGNVVYSTGGATIYGIKYTSTPITSVPTETPNTGLHTYADGIGHYSSSAGFAGSGWLINAPITVDGATFSSGSIYALAQNSAVFIYRSLLIPCDTGGRVTVWQVYRG